MKQKQSDTFRSSYSQLTDNECWSRAEKTAKHLLTAIAFKESSKACLKKTQSILLPPIGQYYSVFHMSVAFCWLHPKIEAIKLKKVKHSALRKLLLGHYIEQNILPKSYSDLMQNLQDEREWLNYTFGEFDYDFYETVVKNDDLVSSEFKICFSIIDEICKLLMNRFDIKQRIKIFIADSKGDDFLQTYLSETEHDAVLDYLVSTGYCN